MNSQYHVTSSASDRLDALLRRLPWIRQVMLRWPRFAQHYLEDDRYRELVILIGRYFTEVEPVLYFDDDFSHFIQDYVQACDVMRELRDRKHPIDETDLFTAFLQAAGLNEEDWEKSVAGNMDMLDNLVFPVCSMIRHFWTFQEAFAAQIPDDIFDEDPDEDEIA